MRNASKLILLLPLLIAAPAAFSQSITARFYPEKQEYVVGEPVVVVMEVTNDSSYAVIVSIDNCGWPDSNDFQVTNARIALDAGHPSCAAWGGGGGCGGSSNNYRTGPGAKFERRFVLHGRRDSHFDLSQPGWYHVRAAGRIRVYASDLREGATPVDVSSEFDIHVRDAYPGELESSYQRFVKDLTDSGYEPSVAIAALTQNPPKFLETVILSLAESTEGNLRFESVAGLKRLGTPAAHAKLLEMASGPDEVLAQWAIPALGELANPDDCDAMLKIALRERQTNQVLAYMAAGRICRKRAIPVLLRVLSTADVSFLQGIATALGDTESRDAIPPLISLLASPNDWVRRAAEEALFTLTHRPMEDVSTPDAAAKTISDWRSWWFMNRESAQVYGPDQCPANGSD